MAKGIRKIKGGWGNQDSVLVKYPNGAEMEIPASQYVAQGHHPLIDALPALSSSPRPPSKAINPDPSRSQRREAPDRRERVLRQDRQEGIASCLFGAAPQALFERRYRPLRHFRRRNPPFRSRPDAALSAAKLPS